MPKYCNTKDCVWAWTLFHQRQLSACKILTIKLEAVILLSHLLQILGKTFDWFQSLFQRIGSSMFCPYLVICLIHLIWPAETITPTQLGRHNRNVQLFQRIGNSFFSPHTKYCFLSWTSGTLLFPCRFFSHATRVFLFFYIRPLPKVVEACSI